MLQVFLLIFSLSIDSLMAGFSLGINRIHIPIKYLFLLNGIGAFLLFVSISFGTYFESYVSTSFAHFFSTILFLILGISKLLEGFFHRLTSKERKMKLQFSQVEFIFHIYAHPEVSDMDLSKYISCKEAFCLGLALSLDNLAIGVGIGLLNIPSILVTILSFFVGTFLITIGHLIGMRICKNQNVETAWLSGFLLIALAFLK